MRLMRWQQCVRKQEMFSFLPKTGRDGQAAALLKVSYLTLN